MDKYIVIGTGGHANSIIDLIVGQGGEVECFVDFDSDVKSHLGKPVVTINDLSKFNYKSNLVFAIGNPVTRKQAFQDMSLQKLTKNFPPLVHKTSYIAEGVKLGFGTVLLGNVFVGPNSQIGNFCILNTKSSIDHDCQIGDFNILSPSVTVAGTVLTGPECYFGMGALISNNLSIGAKSTIGANSFVKDSVPANSFFAGSPARKINS
jgi:sugar O-acyltransferase (sialic acid O-acetyltransferase NeuD family)